MKHWFTYPRTVNADYPEYLTGESLIRVARAAEAAGFDGIGITDHPAPSQEWLDGIGHDALDPLVALAAIATGTERIRLIPNILVLPYRNPFLVAKAAATLDMVSSGRFVLSVALGYLESEYAALGVEFAQRGAIFEESLAAIRGVWAEDQFSFSSPRFTADKLTVHPRPARRLPIWIGGNSAVSRRRVAVYGDGWNPFSASSASIAKVTRTAQLGSLDELEPLLEDLWRRVEEAGRDRNTIDVCFTNPLPGPGDPRFEPGAFLEAFERMEQLGVTWTSTVLPRSSMSATLDAIEHYGVDVIAPSR